jgi:hypothetical protein
LAKSNFTPWLFSLYSTVVKDGIVYAGKGPFSIHSIVGPYPKPLRAGQEDDTLFSYQILSLIEEEMGYWSTQWNDGRVEECNTISYDDGCDIISM